MENTNLSEEAQVLVQLDSDIHYIELSIEKLESQLYGTKLTLEKLKERKISLLNYLNTDNN